MFSLEGYHHLILTFICPIFIKDKTTITLFLYCTLGIVSGKKIRPKIALLYTNKVQSEFIKHIPGENYSALRNIISLKYNVDVIIKTAIKKNQAEEMGLHAYPCIRSS